MRTNIPFQLQNPSRKHVGHNSTLLSRSVDGNFGGECNVIEKYQLSPGSLPDFCKIHQMTKYSGFY